MPGTIHVSVLGFYDLPSTSSSSVLFKVSLGKREYQTLDKGDFSFPVKSLREKLILVVLDDVGSEISQAVVEAILIVQKGQWDDYFSLDDGGRVHMKLQFTLSDEDRVKIRKMRESALQKKRSQLFITHPEFQRSISLGVGLRTSDISVDVLSQHTDGNEATKTTPVCNAVSFSNTSLYIHDEDKGDTVNKEQVFPNDMGRTEEAVTPLTVPDAATIRSAEVITKALDQNQEVDIQNLDKSPGALKFKPNTFTSKGKVFIPKVDEEIGTTINEGSLRKTPSSVKKMISAFEFTTTQDNTQIPNKPPPLQSPINKLGFENLSDDLIEDEAVVAAATEKLAEMSSEIVVSPSFFSELRQKVLAKKRQISYDVVEIITVAPERSLAEAGANEVGIDTPETESENETCVFAFDAVERFEETPVDMRIYDMASGEGDTSLPAVGTREGVDRGQIELDNKDMQVFDDKIELATVEKDIIIRLEGDSYLNSYMPPQDQMENLNDETENSISAKDTLLATKCSSVPENDDMHSAKQLLLGDMALDNQNSENSIRVEDTFFVTEDGSGPEKDQSATVYGDTIDSMRSVKQLVFDDTHSVDLNSGGRTIKVQSEKKPLLEDPPRVNKGVMSSTKLDIKKPLLEWSPTSEPPSSWVFPDETRAPCIAPSSIQLTNSIGVSKVEETANTREQNICGAKKPCQERKPVNETSRSPGANDSAGDPSGQFAKAIKIAIMVGFGALVFFSRQRNHR